MLRFGDRYQISLIILGVIATAFLGVFFWREVAPEYLIYQDDYEALEKFRSSYTGEPPSPFKKGVKQIVIEREDKGPAHIDRCISCHVALQIPDFSPTKIAYDVNGYIQTDENGFPVKIPNENYVWNRLDLQIKKLRQEGDNREADRLEALKTASQGEFEYDVIKVLQMHPLMGRETRPFEYHPIEEYGCTSCHNGNGRGLVTDRAHGPVFDGKYEIESEGFKPEFLERDAKNDPKFSSVFNSKPGHRLLFQTDPLYVGKLIQAKCAECHLTSKEAINNASSSAQDLLKKTEKEIGSAAKNYQAQIDSLTTYVSLQNSLLKGGYENTLKEWTDKSRDYALPPAQLESIESQLKFLKNHPKDALQKVNDELMKITGGEKPSEPLSEFIKKNQVSGKGTLALKYNDYQLNKEVLLHLDQVKTTLKDNLGDENTIGAIQTDVDRMMSGYVEGRNQFISQACYACHRISGFARGGVGPELTKEGNSYPWFVKESITWPQADLKTSTMPNYVLDHDEIESLLTFLLGQKGERKALAGSNYKTMIADWEAGKKLPWEEAVSPSKIYNLDYSMTVFATEGCASCHRLKGYQSDSGFAVEKEKPDFDALFGEREWFKNLIPENITGKDLAKTVLDHQDEINRRIVPDVRSGSLLERIESSHPGLIASFYPAFKYAERSQNSDLQGTALKKYNETLNRVLMVFAVEYGLGRQIGPRPNWSGVMRTDEWLMEHFKAPSSHVSRSIMPVFPFDESKFWSLTHMLNVLGRRNRDELRKEWDKEGFHPAEAYSQFCAQCHGDYLQGDGPVSPWIYPLPKNLNNVAFMRSLTKERLIYSLTHGVSGTPMPPWGETGKDKPDYDGIPVMNADEIEQLADWLYSFLPGQEIYKDAVPKWKYGPKDVMEELRREKGELPKNPSLSSYFPSGKGYTAALKPVQTREYDTVFDTTDNPAGGPDRNYYYIKKEYYTPENIAAGQAFFWENCAACHGKDADGAGLRAEAMYDAKPRMLINLDWINSKDDLRLLRSIKFGVPGTSMTAWGDLTTSKQRLQLVIFIRSLTLDNNLRSQFMSAIYQAFDRTDQTVESVSVKLSEKMDALEGNYEKLKEERKLLEISGTQNEIVAAYKKEVEAKVKLSQAQKEYADFSALLKSLNAEKEVYTALGQQILIQKKPEPLMENYLSFLKLLDNKIALKEGKLVFQENKNDQEKMKLEEKKILDQIDSQLKEVKEKKIEMEKSPAEVKRLTDIINTLEKLRAKAISTFAQAETARNEQKKTLPDIKL